MLALVKGMDAVSYKQLRNLTACSGYPILFSNSMDAVNSLALMNAKSYQWNGCCELETTEEFHSLLWLPNSVG